MIFTAHLLWHWRGLSAVAGWVLSVALATTKKGPDIVWHIVMVASTLLFVSLGAGT